MKTKVKISENAYELDEKFVFGKDGGKKLFAVINVDTDDSEDSTVELWRADDDAELEKLVKSHYCWDDDEENEEDYNEMVSQQFDEDWGFKLIPKEIGTIQ